MIDLFGGTVPRIFVSQKRVQQWTEEGRVAIDGNQMTLPELARTFKLTEAFYIQRAVSEDGDQFKLAGRVKTRTQIATLGGEVFLNSLIIGDTAYEGDPGFIGEPVAAGQRSGRAAAAMPGAGSGRATAVSPSAKTAPKSS
jgi:hypothetical protein